MDNVEEYLFRLAAKARKCRRYLLHRSRTHVIFGESPADAAGMLYITSAITCRPSGKKNDQANFSGMDRHIGLSVQPLEGHFLSRRSAQKKLVPVLVQLPPHWKANPKRLNEFLKKVPSGQRFAVEFRDPSWLDDSVFAILEKHQAALCVHGMIDDHPDRTTTDWVYYRFHGRNYGGEYSYQKLSAVADRLTEHIRAGRDVFAYFNNDLEGHAVHNALDLQRYVEARISTG